MSRKRRLSLRETCVDGHAPSCCSLVVRTTTSILLPVRCAQLWRSARLLDATIEDWISGNDEEAVYCHGHESTHC